VTAKAEIMFSTFLSVCVCVFNKPKSGSGDLSCSVDHHVIWLRVFGRCLYVSCMFVPLSQQNLVSTTASQPLEMRRRDGCHHVADAFTFLAFVGIMSTLNISYIILNFVCMA